MNPTVIYLICSMYATFRRHWRPLSSASRLCRVGRSRLNLHLVQHALLVRRGYGDASPCPPCDAPPTGGKIAQVQLLKTQHSEANKIGHWVVTCMNTVGEFTVKGGSDRGGGRGSVAHRSPTAAETATTFYSREQRRAHGSTHALLLASIGRTILVVVVLQAPIGWVPRLTLFAST